MTPEFEQARGRIEVFCSKWDKLMDMGWLSIKDTFNPNYSEDEKYIVAETEVDWEYRAGVRDWRLPRVCAIADDTLEAVVVHENVHLLIASMESLIKPSDSKMCEFAVESIARAILSVHRGSK